MSTMDTQKTKCHKKNNSSNLIYIAQCIANIINKPFEETAEQIRLNSVKFFNI